MSEISLSSLLHFTKDHGGDLFWSEILGFPLVLNLDGRFAGLGNDFEWPVLLIFLDISVVSAATDETFRVKDSVFGVGVMSVFSGISDSAGYK